MTGPNPDLRQSALQYREKLKTELAKVDQFLELADEISRSNETFRAGADGPGADAPLELEQRNINVFRESG